MYTIGQVSEMFNIPISTLRYYDNEGFFPNMQRHSGIRDFSENEIAALRIVECLKSSGLEIKEIKQFMEMTTRGAETYEDRLKLFEARRDAVENEICKLQRTLDMLKYKCWYYEQAIKDGNEDNINAMLPDKLPPKIQKLYDNGNQKAV
ncbi:MerR family transcriptional regulator [Pseudobutyrivibrio sp.]|uniref:MerR family transcriptional regulator n=1 Tax=Pseudobutyrivibrio sp. TaxID=2014367 RepID=UPI0025E2DE04|nr:MerR family transcriptional regulator [Pseudobutyrivibrio sp.]MBQ8490471.1 MerR family transcriptional regulator [Pseudobutyrivibrio sp.]